MTEHLAHSVPRGDLGGEYLDIVALGASTPFVRSALAERTEEDKEVHADRGTWLWARIDGRAS